MYTVHHVIINFIEKNYPLLAEARPLFVLLVFLIAALYAAILDQFVDSYFRRLRKQLR